MEDALQDALEVHSNLLPWRKTVELHHIKQTGSARDLVLPPWPATL